MAALVDAYVDRMFGCDPGAEDILVYRAAMAGQCNALDLVMGLCTGRPGLGVTTEAVPVPIESYGALGLEDFMVSLYNNSSVQRVMMVLPEGTRRDMLAVLAEAIAALD